MCPSLPSVLFAPKWTLPASISLDKAKLIGTLDITTFSYVALGWKHLRVNKYTYERFPSNESNSLRCDNKNAIAVERQIPKLIYWIPSSFLLPNLIKETNTVDIRLGYRMSLTSNGPFLDYPIKN